MDTFLDNAERILEAAECCAPPGPSPFTILVNAEGGIEMVAASDWPLESLRHDHGAEAAYRVGHREGRVFVEGRSRSRTCRCESEPPAAMARRLLDAGPAYRPQAGLLRGR